MKTIKAKKEYSLEDKLYIAGILCLFLASGVAYVTYRWLIPHFPYQTSCFLWNVCGVYCPGCGGTRAFLALLNGNILLSLWYHPLVLYTVILYGWFMGSHTVELLSRRRYIGMRFHEWQLYGALGIILFHFIFHNVLKFGWGILM